LIVDLNARKKPEFRAGDTARPGDVVYDLTHRFGGQPHVGIVIKVSEVKPGEPALLVLSLPGLHSDEDRETSARTWPWKSKPRKDQWKADVLARRNDIGARRSAEVARIARDNWGEFIKVGSSDPSRQWNLHNYKRTRKDRLGRILFLSGTCVGFVEHCYEQAKLDLVDDDDRLSLPEVEDRPGLVKDLRAAIGPKADAYLRDRTLMSNSQLCAFSKDDYPHHPASDEACHLPSHYQKRLTEDEIEQIVDRVALRAIERERRKS
jgi:hypothetical protein